MKIVIEVPTDDKFSGGVKRMLRIAMELPTYSRTCGGVTDSIYIASQLKAETMLRFQNIKNGYPFIDDINWTVGMPDHTFPECDAVITYSDNPHIDKLCRLPQIKKVYVLMLSYGMSITHERHNILMPNVTVLCSSKKIEKAILAEGIQVHRLGLGLNMSAFSNNNKSRKNYLCILYHDMESKRYLLAVKVSNMLFDLGIIEGVISFGRNNGYATAKKPKGLVKHYENATPKQVSEIFNQCKCFLMPSITEGMNLTPIESTLCGCPAVLVDGAIGEVFFNEENCFIAKKESSSDMVTLCTNVIENFDTYSPAFQKHMEETIKGMTWDKVMAKLTKILYA